MNYNKTTEAFRKISNKYDLMGLISMGCPDDEYDPETDRLIPLIEKTDSIETIAEKIIKVYTDMFSESFEKNERVMNFAKELKESL